MLIQKSGGQDEEAEVRQKLWLGESGQMVLLFTKRAKKKRRSRLKRKYHVWFWFYDI